MPGVAVSIATSSRRPRLLLVLRIIAGSAVVDYAAIMPIVLFMPSAKVADSNSPQSTPESSTAVAMTASNTPSTHVALPSYRSVGA